MYLLFNAVSLFLASAAGAASPLSSNDWAVRGEAARAVLTARDSSAVSALRVCMADDAVDATLTCAWAAHRLGDAAALDIVTRELEARLIHRRVNAVTDLASFRDAATAPLLLAALRRWPWQARAAAATALGALGDERFAAALAERLSDSAWVVRRDAIFALARLARGPLVLEPVAESAQHAPSRSDASPFTTVDADLDTETPVDARTIGSPLAPLPLGFATRLRARLFPLLRDEWPAIRGAALAALGRFGTRADQPLIVRGLSNRDAQVRQGAVAGAVAANVRGLVALLKRRLADPNADVALAAARALKSRGESLPAAFGVSLLARVTDRASLEHAHSLFVELGPDASSTLFASLVDPALDRHRRARHAAYWLSKRLAPTGVAAHTWWRLAVHHGAAQRRLYAAGQTPHTTASVTLASFASPLPVAPSITARTAQAPPFRSPRARRRRSASAALPAATETIPGDPPGEDPHRLDTRWPRHALYNMRPQNAFNAEILTAIRELPGLDPLILKSLIVQESNLDPWARNDYDCAGLAQFCPYAGRDEGLPPSRKKEAFLNDPRYDPRRALAAAARHLRRKLAALNATAFRRFGSPTGGDLWAFVLASYNGGERQVFEAMERTYEKGLAVFDATHGDAATANASTHRDRDAFARAYSQKWDNVLGDIESFEDAPLFKMTTGKYYWYRPYGRYAPLAGAAAKYYEIGLFPVEILERARQTPTGPNGPRVEAARNTP